jgi:hypothetical protein
MAGHVPPRSKLTFSVSYTPKEATTIISNIILTVTNEQPIISKVSAIGKYPYI